MYIYYLCMLRLSEPSTYLEDNLKDIKHNTKMICILHANKSAEQYLYRDDFLSFKHCSFDCACCALVLLFFHLSAVFLLSCFVLF